MGHAEDRIAGLDGRRHEIEDLARVGDEFGVALAAQAFGEIGAIPGDGVPFDGRSVHAQCDVSSLPDGRDGSTSESEGGRTGQKISARTVAPAARAWFKLLHNTKYLT